MSLPLGKYKGQQLADVLVKDRPYLEWLAKQAFIKDYYVYPELVKALGGVATVSTTVSDPQVVSRGDDMTTVSSGKYAGQPVETLLADRDYCSWLLQQSWFVKKPLYERVKKALSNTGSGFALPSEEAVRFGKYKGKSQAELLADTEYCYWLSTREGFGKHALDSKIAEAAKRHTPRTKTEMLSSGGSTNSLSSLASDEPVEDDGDHWEPNSDED